jgi:phosphoglycolate phosphatase
MNKKTLILDFDGVIADSFDYCLKINQTVVGDITADEYKNMFLGNFYEAHRKRVPESESIENKKRYWKIFLSGIDQIHLVGGIAEILNTLSNDFRLVIISSATSDVVKAILNREGISGYITKIFGADVSESKFLKFKMFFNEYCVQSSDCLFVTDTLGDLLEAEKAGVKSLAVSWGFHDVKTLERGNPLKIVDSPKDLLREIEQYYLQSN